MAINTLAQSLTTGTVPASDQLALPNNPFVGLRPFNSNEGPLFFGRDEQTLELLKQLHLTRFLAVVGSSGCGKSSLIRAGLIPKLRGGFLVGKRDRWIIATMKPGDNPLANFCQTLVSAVTRQDNPTEAAALLKSIRTEGIHPVTDVLQSLLQESTSNLLLLVDQFEELFSFALLNEESRSDDTDTDSDAESPQAEKLRRREEAADFVSLMLGLATQKSLPVYVVMTMRSDFLGDCDSFYGLPEAMNRSQYLVPRLSRLQRQQAIESPIVMYGKTITGRLVDRVLNDAGEDADQLPVMQHALMRTWEHWLGSNSPSIDLQDYEAVGTTQRALANDAETALEGMSDNDLNTAERLFQALTDTDAKGRRVRRPTHLSELAAITGAGRAKVLQIINRFHSGGRSFLTISQDPGDPLIDISHESLIRQWQTLRKWVDTEARYRELYLRLVGTALRYYKPEPEDDLWSGPALQYALEWQQRRTPNKAWAQRYHPEFDKAIKFLEESKAKREHDASEKERLRNQEAERERRELENQRRVAEAEAAARRLELERVSLLAEQTELFNRRYRKVTIALCVLLLVTVFATVIAFSKARQAKNNAALAKSNQDKADALRVLADLRAKDAEDAKEQLGRNLVVVTGLKLNAEKQTEIATQRAAAEEAAKKAALAAIAQAKGITEANQLHRDAVKAQEAAHYDEARKKYEDAINRYRHLRTPDLDGAATTSFELGRLVTDPFLGDADDSPDEINLSFAEQPTSKTDREAGFKYFTDAINGYRKNHDPNGSASVLFTWAERLSEPDSGFYGDKTASISPNDRKALEEARRGEVTRKYEEALEDFKAAKNKEGQIKVLSRLGMLLTRTSNATKEDKQQALAYYKRIIPLAADAQLPTVLITIGKLYYDLDQRAEATTWFDQADMIYRTAKKPDEEVKALLSIARLLGSGDADRYYDRAEQVYPEPKDRAGTLVSIASSLTFASPDKALDYYRRALTIYQGLNDIKQQATVLTALGSAYSRQIKSAAALENYRAAIALYQTSNDSAKMASLYVSIGNVQLTDKQYDEAINSFRTALGLYEGLKDTTNQAMAYYYIARAQVSQNKYQEAIATYNKGLEALGNNESSLRSYLQDQVNLIKKKLPQ